MGKRIVVIGAGIVGASVAYHLADQGAKVTLVDAGDIASGVTGRSFAWINVSHSEPDPIATLRGAAIEEYRRLKAGVPGLKIRWTGAISYPAAANHTLGEQIGRAQIHALEPNLRNPPAHALYAAHEGALDSVAATRALVAGAQAKGATVLTQTDVLGFTLVDRKVVGVETTAGNINADSVVLAAGTGIAKLTQMLGQPLPVEDSPCIFIRYRAQSDLVRTLISNPRMEVRQSADGALLAAEDYMDDTVENRPAAIALRTAKAIQAELRAKTPISLEQACVGLRPMPVDGIPIIGYLPDREGVYVCAMHPGVTLAAVVGRLAGEEIIGKKTSLALAPCRPDRFFQA